MSCLIRQQIHHQFKELRNQHDIEVMKGCDVIGMTVTGATLRANILGNVKQVLLVSFVAALRLVCFWI